MAFLIETNDKDPPPSDKQYRAALYGVYDAARIIGSKAADGATPWELVRGLAMMIDDLDRALGWRVVGVSTYLWSTSDALRAEARESAVTRPRETEDE